MMARGGRSTLVRALLVPAELEQPGVKRARKLQATGGKLQAASSKQQAASSKLDKKEL